MDNEKAFQIALGNINVNTGERIADFNPDTFKVCIITVLFCLVWKYLSCVMRIQCGLGAYSVDSRELAWAEYLATVEVLW